MDYQQRVGLIELIAKYQARTNGEFERAKSAIMRNDFYEAFNCLSSAETHISLAIEHLDKAEKGTKD